MINLRKPIHTGTWILDLSKVLMQDLIILQITIIMLKK